LGANLPFKQMLTQWGLKKPWGGGGPLGFLGNLSGIPGPRC